MELYNKICAALNAQQVVQYNLRDQVLSINWLKQQEQRY